MCDRCGRPGAENYMEEKNLDMLEFSENLEAEEHLEVEAKQEPAEAGKETLVPKMGTIRLAMEATGWSAYDTYCHLHEMHDVWGASYDEIRIKSLWKEYKIRESEALFEETKAPYEADISLEEFNELFYNERQRKAIEELKQGKLTLRIICNYMKIKAPKTLDGIKLDEDITERIAFRPNQLGEHFIYFCPSYANANPEAFIEHKPALIIGKPEYEGAFEGMDIPYIKRMRLQSYISDLVSFWRMSRKAKVVTLTGSYGKTSATEMLATVFEDSLRTYKSWNNYNVLPWIERYMLDVAEDREVFVQECSGAGIGKLEKISRTVLPDIFAITNVGTSHIEDFDGNRKLLLHEKVAFDRYANDGAIGIVNMDDELLRRTNFKHKVIWYSMSDPAADYHAENITEHENRITCDIVDKAGKRAHVTINLFGVHNIYNAMISFIAGKLLGINEAAIVRSIASYRAKGIRQHLVEMNGQKVYLDFFNATDGSIKAALEAVAAMSVPADGQKYAVIGDILGVGELEEEMHRNVGNIIADTDSVDKVFFFGNSVRFAYDEAIKHGVNAMYSENFDEVLRAIRETIKAGDLVLFKASHAMNMHRFVDALYDTGFLIEDELIVSTRGDRYINGSKYRAVKDLGCCLLSGDKSAGIITLPVALPVNEEGSIFDADKSESGEPSGSSELRVIGAKSFERALVKKIEIPDTVTCIGCDAFHGCGKLKKVKLPAGLKVISENAFANCVKLRRIEIPDGTTSICGNAFSGCRKLRKIQIPESVRSIVMPFDEDARVVIICPKGSYADEWAHGNGYRVRHSH